MRAVWAEFGATVRAVSGWSSYFSTAGESCWLNLFDIQLVRYTGKVIYPAVRTTASTHRLNDSTPHDNRRASSLGHTPFALIAAQPSAPAPPHVCREQAKHPYIAYRTHSARAGPLPVPEHARTPVSPLARRRRPQVLSTRFRSGLATPGESGDDCWLYQYVLVEIVAMVP